MEATEATISGTARRRRSNLTGASEADVSLGGIALLIVDPQVDFHEGGSLAVPGACADAARIARLIVDHSQDIDEVVVTLDSHHRMDIAHPQFWTDKAGSRPSPFTTITCEDVKNGTWLPVQEEHTEHCIDYTRKLAERGRFQLCVWPEHCLVSAAGRSGAVDPVCNLPLQAWAVSRQKLVTYVEKGHNPLTEHYSCFAVEVPVGGDEENDKGRHLLAKLCARDSVLVCGQASSHCFNFSARDLANAWKRTTAGAPKDEARRRMAGLVLLEDGTSPVTGFEGDAKKCFHDLVGMGTSVSKCEEALGS
eukprot:jgi/Undpi1/1295/HiC_scaffold_11.g04687.m1